MSKSSNDTPRIKLSAQEFLELWETTDPLKLEEKGVRLENDWKSEPVWVFENIDVEQEIVVADGKTMGNLSLKSGTKSHGISVEKGATSATSAWREHLVTSAWRGPLATTALIVFSKPA